MRKNGAISGLMCWMLVLALLGYGLDFGCLLRADGCVPEAACCVSCNLPAHLDESDQADQVKPAPLLVLLQDSLFRVIVVQLAEVEPPLEPDHPPRSGIVDPTDPVRGPPLA